jgi:hypothetical protein
MTLPWELPTSPDRLICMANQIGKFFRARTTTRRRRASPNISGSSGIRACAPRYRRIPTPVLPDST